MSAQVAIVGCVLIGLPKYAEWTDGKDIKNA